MGTESKRFTQILGGRLLAIGEVTQETVDLAAKLPNKVVNLPTLEFDNGTLTIENPFTLTVGGTTYQSANSTIIAELKKVIGSTVIDSAFENESIVVKFGESVILTISLREDDYTSPEAGSFRPSTGPIVVFQ